MVVEEGKSLKIGAETEYLATKLWISAFPRHISRKYTSPNNSNFKESHFKVEKYSRIHYKLVYKVRKEIQKNLIYTVDAYMK